MMKTEPVFEREVNVGVRTADGIRCQKAEGFIIKLHRELPLQSWHIAVSYTHLTLPTIA